ncbi:GNAT family N-acetyltransferase [Sphingobacterium multivorum]|uniref:GNAT family N-acetyltransferase n=1 Tax=Sphingobacterium multivorum TaxID=28454 RepID=UPI00191A1335|nr:GNAT family N-acetyltransferase [Sphingobacterium multivorum]QQT61149.1 GNAT family N-acetyltransferase [Sphingobacterium multivorum]
MEIRKLKAGDSADLLNAINGAFADYIVPFQLDALQLESKIRGEDILMDLSVGVFDGIQLVAFIMHGMREIEGSKVIYNAGTGVLPAYRNSGLVGEMYRFMQPSFREYRVKKLLLEVIESNRRAIRVYEKNGFVKGRRLLCFGGELHVKMGALSGRTQPIRIQSIHDFCWDILQSFWDVEPSWQNRSERSELIQLKGLGAFIGSDLVGYILFNSSNRRIYQIAVAQQHRRKGIATQLLSELKVFVSSAKVQITNVDEKAKNLQLFLQRQGLVNTINQIEMVKMIF